MKHPILFLILLISFTSCIKDQPISDGVNCYGKCYELTGQVVDTFSGLPLQDVTLNFSYRERAGIAGLYTKFNLGKIKTNANGFYSFKFNGSKLLLGGRYYNIAAEKADYIEAPTRDDAFESFTLDSSNINIPYNQNIKLCRAMKINFRVNATTPNFTRLYIEYRYNTFYGYKNIAPTILGGRLLDTSFSILAARDFKNYISWGTTGLPTNFSKKDTINPTGIAFYNYNINF